MIETDANAHTLPEAGGETRAFGSDVKTTGRLVDLVAMEATPVATMSARPVATFGEHNSKASQKLDTARTTKAQRDHPAQCHANTASRRDPTTLLSREMEGINSSPGL